MSASSWTRAVGAAVRVAVAALFAAGAACAQDLPTLSKQSLPPALRNGPNASGTTVQDPLSHLQMSVRLSPSSARIGQALTYRGSVLVSRDTKVRFEPPQTGGAFTWTRVHAGRGRKGWLSQFSAGPDSVWFEARLQVFESGRVAVQGPVVQLSRLPQTTRPGSVRLPTVRVTILPTLTAADSNSQLRGLHGPLGAPWWERIGWVPILTGLVLLVFLVWLYRRLRRKKPVPVPAPAASPMAPRPRYDPAGEALRALAALRTRELPQAGRFSEHAFELTAILRRFLEATITTPRPGDTSGELLERLRSARMPEDDYERLEGLLSLWDRVKFARAPLTEAEAFRCEEAVESFVRRIQAARAAATAAAAAPAAGAPRPGTPPAPEAA